MPAGSPPTSARGTESLSKGGVSSASVPAGSREGGATRSGGSSSSTTGTPSFAANPLAHGRHANPFTATPVPTDAANPFDAPKQGTTTTAGNPFDMAPDFTSLDGGMPFVDLRMPMLEAPIASMTDASGIEATPNFSSVGGGDSLDEIDRGLIRELGGIAFDPYRVRADFPILDEEVHGKRLVWLDNAATTQKPLAVIRRLSEFYKHENSNIHRAAHTLAARATDAYEKARATTREFLNATSTNEIIFVRGATEGINLVAQSWGRKNVGHGDEIVITHLEHHANIVPWQQLCSEKGARLRVAPVDDRGDVILEEYEKLLGPKTKLVSLPQVSNALGTITPARQMVEMAHRYGARVLVDGAQAVSHMRVDVQLLDCDFYVFSGHKVFAPTGIGAVFGKRELLEAMPPWQGGGNMIQDVTFERTTYQAPPFRFEAGTGNIADAAGLGTALEYVMRIGMDTIDRYEHDLLTYATGRLAEVPGLTMIGTSPNKAGVLSFVLDGQRTEDVGAALDQEGIAVRSGHHCAQPILRRFGVEATVRASLAFYNVCEDIDALVAALQRLQAGR